MADGSGPGDIVIDSYPDTNKRPGFFGETNFATGAQNVTDIPMTVLLVGLKSSAGSMTVDQDVVDVYSNEDADTYAGPGSELARMVYAALLNGRGYRLKIAAPAPNGSGVTATATITLATDASSVGVLRYLMCGLTIDVTIPSGSTPTQAAVLVVAAINAQTKLPFTAGNLAGVITLTCKYASVRGNSLIVYQDINNKPGGMTSAVTGGSAVLSSTSGQTGCYFTSGAGVEDLTNILAATVASEYERQAWACNDTTCLGLLEPQVDAKALPGEEKLEHVVIGHIGTSGAATSIGQTTLNNARFQLVWMQNCEVPPSELAAAMVGLRASKEQKYANSAYDGTTLKGIPPHRYTGYIPTSTVQQTCLDNSVTPMLTKPGGIATIVRSIGTRSLNGSTPDWRCLDTGESATPDFIRKDFRFFWDTEFRPANDNVGPNGANGTEERSGVATPALWEAKAYARMLKHQENKLVTAVAQNRPKATYNYVAKRLMSEIPVIVQPKNHAIGVKFNQAQLAA